MRNVILKSFSTVMLIGMALFGAFCAVKIVGLLDQLPSALFILLMFDALFLFTIYQIVKNKYQITIKNIFDYRILFILMGSFVFGLGAIFISLTISGILVIAFGLI